MEQWKTLNGHERKLCKHNKKCIYNMQYDIMKYNEREPAYKELMEACRTSWKVVEDKCDNKKGTNSRVVNN